MFKHCWLFLTVCFFFFFLLITPGRQPAYPRILTGSPVLLAEPEQGLGWDSTKVVAEYSSGTYQCVRLI